MRQVVERRLHELEEEEQVKGLKAWSEYIEKHKPDLEPDVKDFIKLLSKHIPMIPSSKLAIAEVYHNVWCERLLKGPISDRPSVTGQHTTCLIDYLAYCQGNTTFLISPKAQSKFFIFIFVSLLIDS